MADSPPQSPLRGHSVSSLNTQLLAHGFAKRPLRLAALPDAEQVNVTAVIVELLGANVTNLERFEDLSARHRALQFEWERLSDKVGRQSHTVARLEHDVEAGKARASEAERRAAAADAETAKLRHEVERGKRALDTLRTAASQESKRYQIQLDKLTAAPRHALPRFELLNPVAAGGTAPAAPGPLPLLEAGIRDLDAQRAGAAEEARAFRAVVCGAANGLREALAHAEGREAERWLQAEFFESGTKHGQASSWASHPSIADIKLKRLLEDVRERLLRDAPPLHPTDRDEEDPEAAARERERRRQEQDLRDRVKDLEVEVSIARAREAEAAKVVEQLARANAHAAVPSTTDFDDARLRDELVRQKRVLDGEREELVRLQAQLSEERIRVAAERAAFESRREEAVAAALEAELARRERERGEAAERDAEQARWDAAGRGWETDKGGRGHKHQPARPSPLSPRTHTKKRGRPSLARLVVERQHHAKAAAPSTGKGGRVLRSAPAAANALAQSTKGPSAPVRPASPARTSPPPTEPAQPPMAAGSSEAPKATTPPPERRECPEPVRGPSPAAPSRTPPGVLTDADTNTGAGADTPMAGGARLLKAGVTLRGERPRKPPSALKPPTSNPPRRTPPAPTPRKPAHGVAAAKAAHNPRKSSLEAAGIRRPARPASRLSGTSTTSDGSSRGETPAQRRLMTGTAASLARQRTLEPRGAGARK